MKQQTKTPQLEAQPATLQAVLDHQEAVSQAQQELQRLQGLQQKHQEQITRAEQIEASMLGMHNRIQDLMADIAAGEDKKQALADLTEEYSKASDALGDSRFDTADGVLAGLARKIERAQADLVRLRGQRPALVRAMLLEQTEAMGAEYAETALKMISLYRRLSAMGHLLTAHGRTQSIFTGANIEVPLFELESVRPYADFHRKGHIVHGPFMRYQSMQFEDAERQRFADLGVDMAPDVA